MMKKYSETEIKQEIKQTALQTKLSAADTAAYQELFKILAIPPKESLPMDFSAKVRGQLKQELQRKERFRFYAGWLLIFSLSMPLLFAGLLILDKAYDTRIIQSVSEHKWIFILAFPMLFLIQYIDHMTIKKDQLKELNK
jgi:hypothetical protein